MRNDILERKNEIITWIEKKESKDFICRELSCRPDTLEIYLKKIGINYLGNQIIETEPVNSVDVKSHKLKNRLIEDGIKEHKCENCGLSDWLGNKIPIELHHIDGKSHNNDLSNLQILCPNCHALTENYRGKKLKKIKNGGML